MSGLVVSGCEMSMDSHKFPNFANYFQHVPNMNTDRGRWGKERVFPAESVWLEL